MLVNPVETKWHKPPPKSFSPSTYFNPTPTCSRDVFINFPKGMFWNVSKPFYSKVPSFLMTSKPQIVRAKAYFIAVSVRYFPKSFKSYGLNMESKQYLAPSIIIVTPKFANAPAVDAVMMAPITIWATPSKKTVILFHHGTYFTRILAYGYKYAPYPDDMAYCAFLFYISSPSIKSNILDIFSKLITNY